MFHMNKVILQVCQFKGLTNQLAIVTAIAFLTIFRINIIAMYVIVLLLQHKLGYWGIKFTKLVTNYKEIQVL